MSELRICESQDSLHRVVTVQQTANAFKLKRFIVHLIEYLITYKLIMGDNEPKSLDNSAVCDAIKLITALDKKTAN